MPEQHGEGTLTDEQVADFAKYPGGACPNEIGSMARELIRLRRTAATLRSALESLRDPLLIADQYSNNKAVIGCLATIKVRIDAALAPAEAARDAEGETRDGGA